MGPMSPWMSGGVSVHVAQLAIVLSNDFRIKAVTPGPIRAFHRGAEVEVRIARQFPVRPLPPFEFLPELRAALGFLRGVDLLHAHDPRLFIAKQFIEKPLVSTFHGYLTLEAIANTGTKRGRPLFAIYDWMVRKSVEMSEQIIAVDNRIAAWLREEYASKEVEVIPNGVDTALFRPGLSGENIRRTHGIPIGPPLVLGAKHLVPKNGLDVLIRAIPHVLQEIPEAWLLIVGEGALRDSLRTVVHECGVEARVVMPGQLPHRMMPQVLGACNVCVVPSIPISGVEEATSILALEAMACGKPVVASNIGGLREIIEDGRTGILTPAGDPEALAQSIVKALKDSNLARSLGERARKHVEAHHSWNVIGRRVAAVYNKILARSEKPGGPTSRN